MVGHNIALDLGFMFHQFFKEMPETYKEFKEELNQNFLPNVYDTKVLSINLGDKTVGKYDLQSLYAKCTTDKKYNSHIGFEADCKDTHP